MRWLDGITNELGQTSGNGEQQRGLAAAVHGVTKSQTTGRLNNSSVCLGFPDDSAVKYPPAVLEPQETWVLIPGLGRFPWRDRQYS